MPPDSEVLLSDFQKNKENDKENDFKRVKLDEMPSFAPFYKCETNSDTTLLVDGIEFPAHRCVIASKLNNITAEGMLNFIQSSPLTQIAGGFQNIYYKYIKSARILVILFSINRVREFISKFISDDSDRNQLICLF